MIEVTEQLARVRNCIDAAALEANRHAGDVEIVAVSKRQPVAKIRAANAAGQLNFGESFVREALEKIEQFDDENIRWHFIGALQSNKTKAVAENFDWVHSVDRLKLAERLSRQRPHYREPLNVCIQVNVDRDGAKRGVATAELRELALAVATLPRLSLRGLMCIPKPRAGIEEQRIPFAELRRCRDDLCPELDTLSMGMSNDLRAAVLEGATLVRVGTAIFGPREGTAQS